jgi:predicted Zn finger-like uncharacterized protein
MNVRCGGCGKTYRVDDARVEGKTRIRLRCSACQSVFEVAVPGATAAAAAAMEGGSAVTSAEPAASPSPPKMPAATPQPAAPAPSAPKPAPAESGGEGGAGTTQTVREGELLSDSGKLRLGAPELPTGKRISLAVLSGPDQGKMIPVDQPRLVIGRSDAEVVLADAEISRRHAVLEVYGDRFIVRDLNSTNGTFVGDRKIAAEEIGNQEEFRVGTSRLMFIVTTPDG